MIRQRVKLNSSGPKTEAGRQHSRMNALRHNLTGQVTGITDDDRAAHDKLSAALIKDLAPEGPMETQLAQRLATDSWRLNRIAAIEDNIFALGLYEHSGKIMPDFEQPGHEQIDAALTTARVFTMQSKQLQLLTLYEQRIQKNLAMLHQLQATRKAEHEAAMQQAAALLQLSEMRGLEYAPTKAAQAQVRCAANSRQDGFVFSNDQIHAAIDRDQRIERASATDFSKYKPRRFQTAAA
jgi:hypothetical protein